MMAALSSLSISVNVLYSEALHGSDNTNTKTGEWA